MTKVRVRRARTLSGTNRITGRRNYTVALRGLDDSGAFSYELTYTSFQQAQFNAERAARGQRIDFIGLVGVRLSQWGL